MLPLNYHHLYYFWSAARAGSLSRAARELPLSQPALSLQLRQLERSVGGKLLDRGRTGVTLTPLGRQVFEHCEKIFTAGDALARQLRRGVTEPPPFRLGFSLSVPREALLRALDAAGVATRVEIFVGPKAEIMDRLSRRALDAALAAIDLSGTLGRDWRGVLLGSFPIRLAAAPRLNIELSDKAQRPVPMLMRPPESPMRKAVESWLVSKGVPFFLGAETEDSELLRLLAARGRGVVGLSALSCDEDIKAGRLTAISKSVGKDHIWLVTPSKPASSTEVGETIERLVQLRLA